MRSYALMALLIMVALTGALLLCDSFRIADISTTNHTAHHVYHQQSAIALPPPTASIFFQFIILLILVTGLLLGYSHILNTLHVYSPVSSLIRARETGGTFRNFLVQYLRTGILNPKLYTVLA